MAEYLTVPCQHCKRPVEVAPWRAAGARPVSCSQRCAMLAAVERRRGAAAEPMARWRQCPCCRRGFMARTGKKRSAVRYCGHACAVRHGSAQSHGTACKGCGRVPAKVELGKSA